MKGLAFFCTFLSCASSLLAQSTRWCAMETDPALTAQLGYSRISKWLITQAQPSRAEQNINQHLLEECLRHVIESDPDLLLLSDDLSRGDVDLAQTLERLFAAFNFPVDEIHRLLHLLAEGHPNETVRATLKAAVNRETTCSVLRQYLIDTDEHWAAALEGLQSVLQGRSPLSGQLFQLTWQAVGLSQDRDLANLFEEARHGNLEATWNLAEGLHPILAQRGTFARLLSETSPPKVTFYNSVWSEVLLRIEQEPTLGQEYYHRLSLSHPLYDEFQALLALTLDHGADNFIQGYLRAAETAPSRFSWVSQQLLQSRPEWSSLDLAYVRNSSALRIQFGQDLANRIRQDPAWSDYLLWELTRPAEAATLTLRLALPSCLGSDVRSARALWQTYDLGWDFSSQISQAGLFDFYPQGESEFRRRMNNGTIDPAALLQFGSGFGHLLAFSDSAWSKIISRDHPLDNQRLRLFLASAFSLDPPTVLAWLETIRSNDSSLRICLANWLTRQGKLPDQATFTYWLDGVTKAVQSDHLLGNADVASFKTWFLDFLNTETGLTAVRTHLAMESYGVPEPLRECMAQTLEQEPNRFWRLFSLLIALDPSGPIGTNLWPQLRQFAMTSDLPSFLLQEVSAQNQAANDAMEPAWREILSVDSLTITQIIQTIQNGSSVSDLSGLVSLTLIQALREAPVWVRAKAILLNQSPHLLVEAELLPWFQEQLFKEGSETASTVSRLLTDPKIREAWQKKLLAAVGFLNKGYIVADFVLHHTQLLPEWNRSIAHAVVTDPRTTQTLLTALIRRRVGDSEWEEQISRMRYQLARLILENRVLFETLLMKKNADFAQRLEAICPPDLKTSPRDFL